MAAVPVSVRVPVSLHAVSRCCVLASNSLVRIWLLYIAGSVPGKMARAIVLSMNARRLVF
jgi:hypothetical protein